IRELSEKNARDDRREAGDGECAQQMIAEDQCEQANGPGIERVEDSPVLLITLGHVAVARDVEVVRPIPAVPDFQPAMEADRLLVLPNCVGNPPTISTRALKHCTRVALLVPTPKPDHGVNCENQPDTAGIVGKTAPRAVTVRSVL